MSAGDPSIEVFLGSLKEQGRSSPAGMHWQRFYEFLQAKRRQDQGKPPVPLILAASGESDASKHRRLGDQLHWAEANGCLNEALRCLTDMPSEDWNTYPLAQWNQDSYPSW